MWQRPLCLHPNPEAAVLASDSEAPAQAPQPEAAAANETEEETRKKRPIVHLLEMHTVSTEQEMIDPGITAFVERAIKDSDEAGVDAIVFDIDTFGGRVDAATVIGDAIIDATR